MEKVRYIPKGAVKVSDKKSDAVAYLYQSPKGPSLRVFYGKQHKPVAAFYYRTEAERAKWIKEYFERRQVVCNYKAEEQAKRKAWVNDYKVGEILGTCWGYDQTNREYYEITAVNGKKLTLREIGTASYETGWCQERKAPLPGNYISKEFTRLAQPGGIKITSCAYGRRVEFTEKVPGVKVYQAGDTSSYA